MSYLWYWPAGGWDWEQWRARQSWQPAGAAAPAPLLPHGATSLAGWEPERARLRNALPDILGRLADRPPDAPAWEVLGPKYLRRGEAPDDAAYTLQRLRYALTADGEWGYAFLLEPAEAAEPRPAVIALHQTVPGGKAEPAGLDSVPDWPGVRDYGAALALQGYVVLVPDAIGFGERQSGHGNAHYHSADEFFAAHPDGSVMAKMAFDTSRAVDLLHALPGVAPDRIGCIGHSHGGYGTLFAMLADDRIRAGVISCGLSLLRTDPGVDRWWRRTALLPRLGLYDGAMDSVPFDFHSLIALVAPRALLIAAAMEDAIFPDLESLPAGVEAARRVYALHGAGDHLRGCFFPGGHRFAPEAFAAGAALLRETLWLEGGAANAS